MEVEDLESGGRQLLDADAAASAYREAVAAFVERWRREAGRDGIDYALLPTDVPPERALRTYLVARAEGAARSSTAVAR
jgi:hypothetical protein